MSEVNQRLFNYMLEEHGVTLLESDINEIKLICEEGRSEQLPCPKCGDYGTIDNQDGTVSTCPCHY